MESGLADIESVRGWEHAALFNASVHDPIEDLKAVANLSKDFGCHECIWHFAPGNGSEYSSTNFLLAGLVLLAHGPASGQTWQKFDQAVSLGENFTSKYPHTFFPTVGPLNEVGLSCAGNGFSFGRTEVYEQDASIMGLGWGYTTASAWDVARFYFDLLGPKHHVVSQASLVYPISRNPFSYITGPLRLTEAALIRRFDAMVRGHLRLHPPIQQLWVPPPIPASTSARRFWKQDPREGDCKRLRHNLRAPLLQRKFRAPKAKHSPAEVS
eukprot:gene17109-biopygen8056